MGLWVSVLHYRSTVQSTQGLLMYGEIYGKDYGEDYGEERYILKQSNKWRNFQSNGIFLAPERSKENTGASTHELN